MVTAVLKNGAEMLRMGVSSFYKTETMLLSQNLI